MCGRAGTDRESSGRTEESRPEAYEDVCDLTQAQVCLVNGYWAFISRERDTLLLRRRHDY
jgi:hypothetical protein